MIWYILVHLVHIRCSSNQTRENGAGRTAIYDSHFTSLQTDKLTISVSKLSFADPFILDIATPADTLLGEKQLYLTTSNFHWNSYLRHCSALTHLSSTGQSPHSRPYLAWYAGGLSPPGRRPPPASLLPTLHTSPPATIALSSRLSTFTTFHDSPIAQKLKFRAS